MHRDLLKGLIIEKKQGIQTDSNQINNYLNELFNEIANNQKEQFLQLVNTPLIVNPLIELMELQSMFSCNSVLANDLPSIINLDTYLKLEKLREFSKNEQFTEECEHIHNKAIFDSVNIALDLQRPYGTKGRPMPWSTHKNKIFAETKSIERIIKDTKEIVMNWINYEAGMLPRAEFMTGQLFDEESFLEMRDKKLNNLINQEVVSYNSTWLNYEREEAETMIDITDMILEHLMFEIIQTILRM